MSTLLWQLRQWTRAVGRVRLIGIGLLFAAALVQMTLVEPRQQTIAAQRIQLTERQLAAATLPADTPAQMLSPLAALPPTGTASQQIGELEQLAQANGLELPRGQYRVAPVTHTPLLRWQLVLPIEGPYPVLHAFIAAALERHPNLTLDEFRLKRDRIESETLLAEFQMSLFVEAAP